MNKMKSYFLKAEDILSYFLGENGELEDTIITNPQNIMLATSDQQLYEALGSIRDYDEFKMQRLVKLLETVDIKSHRAYRKQPKHVLTFERLEELRDLALKKNKQGDLQWQK